MEKIIKFESVDIKKIQLEDYSEKEFSIARLGFLSTRPNTHGLVITEEVLRNSASSVLGKWLVADMTRLIDAGTHDKKEHIVGSIPKDQDVEFVYDEDGYLRAYVDVVVSKIYAQDFNTMFEDDNYRSVSVEMTVETPEDDENNVLSFNIVGVTVLGKNYNPSCPKSDIVFTRFSEEDANGFYKQVHTDSLELLKKFSDERRKSMAEKKTYKVDKSKDAVSDKDWGSVDKTELRNKIMEASNRASLVKSVYMLVEDGWEEAPSEHLKYPVMEFKGNTLVYNKGGLSSALGYAKKENETTVVSKVEKIQKKLGLNETTGKEETTKMSKEIEFAAVDIGDMWSKVWSVIRGRDSWRYSIEGIYEESNKKFAILKDEDGALYRLDFSLTEEGMTAADKLTEVQKEFIETDKVVKFAEPENVEDYHKFAENTDNDDDDDDDCDPEDKNEGDDDCENNDTKKMSAEEMETAMAQLKKDIEDRDNIIMEKDTELEELRAYKKGVEDKEKAMSIESFMGEVKEFIGEDKYKEFREEGLACEMAEIDGWKNKVKAFCFESANKNTIKRSSSVWFVSAPTETKNEKKSMWD